VSGSALIVYVDGGGSYECCVEEVIRIAVQHHEETLCRPTS